MGVSVGAALAVLECVAERGEKLEPPLDAHVVVPHFADALERLVIRNYAKPRVPKVDSKVFDGPGNAANFQVQCLSKPRVARLICAMARTVVPDFADALERLVIRKDAKLRAQR